MYFNFDSAAGIIYEVDVRKGDGERIIIKSLSTGQPFSMDKKYSVALSSYRASGGGDLARVGGRVAAHGRGGGGWRHPHAGEESRSEGGLGQLRPGRGDL